MLLASALPAWAQGGRIDPPDGIPLGSWIVSPSVFAGHVWDSNLQRVDEGERSGSIFGPIEERIWGYGGTLGLVLPFRRSIFEVEYEMAVHPMRLGKLHGILHVPNAELGKLAKAVVRSALACPVHHSLREDTESTLELAQ